MAIVFVGGSQRSGTTLMQTLLCQDRAANPLIQEAKYLRHLVAAFKFGKTHFRTETRDYFRNYGEYVAFNTRIVRAFLRNIGSLFPGTEHIVLREPHLTMLFPELGDLLPRARFVCMVRDPRDTIASMIRVGRKLESQNAASDAMARVFNSGDTAAVCRHFLSFYSPALQDERSDFQKRLLHVRYEDLVGDPVPVIERLRKFTGIQLADFDPNRDPDTGHIDYRKLDGYKAAWATEEYSRRITDTRIGSYADDLAGAEVRVIERECAEFMQRFGYA